MLLDSCKYRFLVYWPYYVQNLWTYVPVTRFRAASLGTWSRMHVFSFLYQQAESILHICNKQDWYNQGLVQFLFCSKPDVITAPDLVTPSHYHWGCRKFWCGFLLWGCLLWKRWHPNTLNCLPLQVGRYSCRSLLCQWPWLYSSVLVSIPYAFKLSSGKILQLFASACYQIDVVYKSVTISLPLMEMEVW